MLDHFADEDGGHKTEEIQHAGHHIAKEQLADGVAAGGAGGGATDICLIAGSYVPIAAESSISTGNGNKGLRLFHFFSFLFFVSFLLHSPIAAEIAQHVANEQHTEHHQRLDIAATGAHIAHVRADGIESDQRQDGHIGTQELRRKKV